MVGAMMRMTLPVLIAALSGCSLVLDWSVDELPCQKSEPECLDGYSCLEQVCVRDGGTERDERCSGDRQCEPGLFCRGAVCRAPCDQEIYAEVDACLANEFCAPFPDARGRTEGYCVRSECRDDADCLDGNRPRSCVPIKVGAQACFSTCEYEFSPGYSDSCFSGFGEPDVYCQAVGRPLRPGAKLVCLEAGLRREGDACHPVTDPCEEGLTCDLAQEDPTCARLCDPARTDACELPEICCRKQYGDAQYDVCSSC